MQSLINSCVLISIYGYPGIDKQRVEFVNELTNRTIEIVYTSSDEMVKSLPSLEVLYNNMVKECSK
jgi:hypothetical protein